MNNVWIEIPIAGSTQECMDRARLLSKMLEKLGCQPDSIVYRADLSRYCRLGADHSFTELEDGWSWYNLDYLARESDG